MNDATRNMINSLTEDILHSFDIQVPIQDIDGLVRLMGGSIQEDYSHLDGAVEKDGESFRILVSPFQDEKFFPVATCLATKELCY